MEIKKVIKSYEIQYSNPIELSIGDNVILGKEETEEKWIGWIWAEKMNGENSGWIPMQIVAFSQDKKSGSITKEYSAQELAVNENDQVEIIELLNGWFRVKNCLTNQKGWIPSECIIP